MRGIRKGVIAATVAAAAISAPVLASHSWDGVHWPRTGNQLRVPVGDNVDGRWDYYFKNAAGDWSKSTIIQSPIVGGKTNPAECSFVTGTIQVCNAAYGATDWLGLASISMSNGHLSAGVAQMNDTYAEVPPMNGPSWRQYVMCQEIGHTYGLDHPDEATDNPNLGTCI